MENQLINQQQQKILLAWLVWLKKNNLDNYHLRHTKAKSMHPILSWSQSLTVWFCKFPKSPPPCALVMGDESLSHCLREFQLKNKKNGYRYIVPQSADSTRKKSTLTHARETWLKREMNVSLNKHTSLVDKYVYTEPPKLYCLLCVFSKSWFCQCVWHEDPGRDLSRDHTWRLKKKEF